MDGMIGEVRIFPGNFVPESWLACDGRLVATGIAPQLFDVLGSRFGASVPGPDIFALPNMADPGPNLRYIICAKGISKVMEGSLAEITLYAGATDPKFALPCDGRTLTINTDQALFAVLSTKFGGDGIRNFRLPALADPIPGVRHVMCVRGWFPERER